MTRNEARFLLSKRHPSGCRAGVAQRCQVLIPQLKMYQIPRPPDTVTLIHIGGFSEDNSHLSNLNLQQRSEIKKPPDYHSRAE